MLICAINKFFYRKGGSETVYFNTKQLLERKGHRVIPFAMHHPQNEPSPFENFFVSQLDLRKQTSLISKIISATRIIYSTEALKRIKQVLDRESVDLAHLHNIHHQLSPSILVELKARGIPVVMTLHDYKMVCPTYTMMSGNKICERCSRGRYWRSLMSNCGQSFSERAILTLEMYIHHKLFKFYRLVDVFISPSMFLKEKLIQMGFKGDIMVLPNFVDIKPYNYNFSDVSISRIVYFGRLSKEKGLQTLIEAVRDLPVEVHIIGDGPLRAELEEAVRTAQMKNVRFLGYLYGDDLNNEVSSALVVVVPSECYENNPLSVIEAFSLAKPVVGSRIGGIPELIRNGQTGLTFTPGNAEELRDKILWMLSHPQETIKMGLRARAFFEKELNPERHYEGLMAIYEQAISKSRKRRG